MLLRFFYLDEGSQLCYYEKEEIYSLKLNNIEMNGEAGVNLLNYDFVINNTSKINLRLSIDYTAFLYQEENIEYITDISTEEMLDDSNAPQLTLYFAKKNESVWDIAKSFSTDSKLIIDENELTSDIIDTGIQNGGVSHCMPQAVTKEEFELAKVFMTEDEVAIWEDSYWEDGDVYRLDVTDEKKLDEYDDEFVTAFILNNQTSAVEESAFKQQIAAQSGQDLHSLKCSGGNARTADGH